MRGALEEAAADACARAGRIAHRPTLFAKLCRLLTDYANKVQPEPDKLNQVPTAAAAQCHVGADHVVLQLLPVVSLVLLPALSWFRSNPGAADELWTLIKIWPYEERFKAYGAPLRLRLPPPSPPPRQQLRTAIRACDDRRLGFR